MSKRVAKPAVGSVDPGEPVVVDPSELDEAGVAGSAGSGDDGGVDVHVGFGWWKRPDGTKYKRSAGTPGGSRGSKRRGSASGGGDAPRKVSLAVSSVERLLYSIHLGIALALQDERVQLTGEESRAYAEAVQAVARHYNVGAQAKTLDWINLLTTIGAIDGTRVLMIMSAPRQPGAETRNPAANGRDGAPVGAVDGIDLSSFRPRGNA